MADDNTNNDNPENNNSGTDDSGKSGGNQGAKPTTGFSKEQMEKAISSASEKARIETEHKFLSRINELEQTNKTLAEQAKQFDELKANYDRLEGEFKALSDSVSGKGKDKIDIQKLIEEVQTKASEQASKQNEEIVKRLQKAEQELASRNLRELRHRLIQENGGENAMITEMVSGDTEEAIRSSIEQAKAVYSSVIERNGGKQGAGNQNNQQNNSGNQQQNPLNSLPPGAGGGQGPSAIDPQLAKVPTMTPAEYAEFRKNKANIVDQLFANAG